MLTGRRKVNGVNLTPMSERTTSPRRLAAALAALALVAGLLVSLVGASPASAESALKVSNNTSIRCAFGTYSTPTDWYLPATSTPRGLVWLQHGFSENKGHWAYYAPKLAAAGYAVFATTLPTADIFGCTLENVGNNRPYLNNIASMFDSAASGSGALVTSYNDAARRAGRPGLAMPSNWAFVGHSAGGETVTYVADRLRSNHPAAFSRLRGLVLEDPVNSFIGTNLADALTGLNGTSLPIRTLASPAGSCNNNQAGVNLVVQKLTTRPFHGALVRTGTHVDVFGAGAGPLLTATCGTPQVTNINAVQTLTTAWLADELAGTTTAANYPGGATYNGLVGAGTISTLP